MSANSQNNDEITLKELILLVKSFWDEWIRKWLIILCCIIPILAYFIYQQSTTPKKYEASLKFIVEGNSGGSYGALTGILGSMGLGRGGSGKTNPYKILEVSKSELLTNEVLFSQSTCSNDLIINKILDEYNLVEKWSENNKDFTDFSFKNEDVEKFDRLERMALKKIKGLLLGSSGISPMFMSDLNIENGTFKLNTSTLSECLSLDIVEIFFIRLKFFFENKVNQELKQSKDLIKEKRDSLHALITYKSQELANFEDRNRGTISSSSLITKRRISLEIQGLTSAFTEATKNYEISDLNYRDSKPLFIAIDTPYSPIYPIGRGLGKSILLGLILGGILGVIVVSLMKVYNDAID